MNRKFRFVRGRDKRAHGCILINLKFLLPFYEEFYLALGVILEHVSSSVSKNYNNLVIS